MNYDRMSRHERETWQWIHGLIHTVHAVLGRVALIGLALFCLTEGGSNPAWWQGFGFIFCLVLALWDDKED